MNSTHCSIHGEFPRIPIVSPAFFKAAVLFLTLFSTVWCSAQTSIPETIPPGFKPLFDGRSLAGWHTAPRIGVPKTAAEALAPAKPQAKGKIATAQEGAKGRWEARDGIIVGGQDELRVVHREDGADWGLGSWLMTDETFGDFELLLDARPDWPCDTGIYVRTTTLGQGFQILLDHRGDDTAGEGGGIGFLYLRGIGGLRIGPDNFRWSVGADGLPTEVKLVRGGTGLDKLDFAATNDDFRRAWRMNDWNTFRIRVVGALPRITVWINDVKICECATATIEHPDYNPADVQKLLGTRGHIAFEVHDGPPWRWGVGKVSRWRNIYLKQL
jgi:hypothetical protein